MKEDLDEDQAGGFELHTRVSIILGEWKGGTNEDSAGLDDESAEMETQLATGGESDACRDQNNDGAEFLVGILDTEYPGDKEN